jgi:ribonuclease P protein subunit POP4
MSNPGQPDPLQSDPIYAPLPATASPDDAPATRHRSAALSNRTHLAALLPSHLDVDTIFDSKLRTKFVYLNHAPRLEESSTSRRKRAHQQSSTAATHAMSSGERKRRCLAALPRALPSSAPYGGLLPLHELWRQYMRSAIGDDHLRSAATAASAAAAPAPRGAGAGASGNAGPSAADTAATQGTAGQKLLRADLHGAYLHVLRASQPQLVGTQGLVAAETQDALRIVAADGAVRTVPKRGAVFGVPLTHLAPILAPGARSGISAEGGSEGAGAVGRCGATASVAHIQATLSSGLVLLYGDQMCFRSSERSVRKFKVTSSIDID